MNYLKTHKKVITIFLIWIVAVNVFALLALNRFNLKADTAYSWIPQNYYQEQGLNFNVIHAQWDSFWLLDIVREGYYLRETETIANVVFFPVYPFLIKVGTFIINDDIFVGWLISIFSLLLALIFLKKLIKEFFPEIDYLETIIFLLIFPTAYFFNAVYTESVFLLLSVATIYYAKKDKIYLVALLGFLAALTRVTGVLLFIPIVWYLLEQNKFNYKKFWKFNYKKLIAKKNLYIFAIPLGLLSFFIFHYLKFDNFLLFFDIESAWGRSFEINKDHFIASNPVARVNLILDLAFVIFSLATTYFTWKKLDRGLALYMLATILVAVSTGTLMSIGRYILVLFPMYMVAASIKNICGKFAWLLCSCMLFTLYTILFVNHYWAG